MTLYDKNGTTIRPIVESDSLRVAIDPNGHDRSRSMNAMRL
jgi:hypothetical protein